MEKKPCDPSRLPTGLLLAEAIYARGDSDPASLSKALEIYDAFDTGLFFATDSLRAAILEAVESGKSGSLSDGVQRLAEEGRASTLEIDGAWWADVDDEPAHASVEAWLSRDLRRQG